MRMSTKHILIEFAFTAAAGVLAWTPVVLDLPAGRHPIMVTVAFLFSVFLACWLAQAVDEHRRLDAFYEQRRAKRVMRIKDYFKE